MNYKLIFRIQGYLVLFIGAAMLLAVPFSLYYGGSDYIAILISSGICGVFGLLTLIGKKRKEDIRPKEGFAVVTLGWIFMSVFGSLPFIISGAIPSYADAFFETMSGFSTTGATILTDIEAMPHGLLFWRSMTHWIGGMGIIVLTIAVLPFLGVGGMQLFKAEVPGPIADKLKPRVTETAKLLWGVYLLFTVIETILLLFGGMNLFDALTHTFGTMATGGFSTKNASVAAFDSAYIDYVIIIFMFIAGTNFSLHYRWLRGNFKDVLANREFAVYVAIIALVTVIMVIDTYGENFSGFFDTLRYSLFQVISIQTTTGYGTADYEQWHISSQIILFFLMFIGGSAGSTGGGMKVLRIYLLVKFVFNEIVRLLHPQAVVPIRIGKKITVERKVMMNILGYFVAVMGISLLSTIILAAMGIDMVTAFGAVAANINNIGPGLGMVGPTDNYAWMPDAAKWLLSFLMIVGRLEVFTVIILFAPSYWRK